MRHLRAAFAHSLGPGVSTPALRGYLCFGNVIVGERAVVADGRVALAQFQKRLDSLDHRARWPQPRLFALPPLLLSLPACHVVRRVDPL